MSRKSWVSHMIINCPGIDRCEHYKPGEVNHPQQHEVRKVVYEDEGSSNASSTRKFKNSGTFLTNLASVPFNPKVDPPVPGACFNCWGTNHFLRDCYSKQKYSFCRNCGRRNVEVEDCPRCSKAYLLYLEEEEHIQAKIELYGDENSDYYQRKKNASLEPKKNGSHFQGSSAESKKGFGSGGSFVEDWRSGSTANRKLAGSISSGDKAASVAKFHEDYKKEHEKVVTGIVNDFKSMNMAAKGKDEQERHSTSCHTNTPVKNEDEQESYDVEAGKREKNFGKSTEESLSTPASNSSIKNDSADCKSLPKTNNEPEVLEASSLSSKADEDDEDYDDMIIDEDEKSVVSLDSGDTVQKFLEFLESIKKLPIEAQNVAIRCFVNAQKKQNQK